MINDLNKYVIETVFRVYINGKVIFAPKRIDVDSGIFDETLYECKYKRIRIFDQDDNVTADIIYNPENSYFLNAIRLVGAKRNIYDNTVEPIDFTWHMTGKVIFYD